MPAVEECNLQSLADLMVSPVTGVLRRIVIAPHEGNGLEILSPLAELADFSCLPGMHTIDTTGGCGFTTRESVARILFESVERYCGAFTDYDRMLWSKPTSDDFLYAGKRKPFYAEGQYETADWPFRKVDEDSEIWWTEARSLLTGKQLFVPSVFVYVPYRPASRAEWLGPSVSTGMAAGWSREEAILSGLLEVCERDAFAIMWRNRLSMPKIAIDPESTFGKQVQRVVQRSGAQVDFINLTNDLGVPVVLTVMRCTYRGRPVLTVGASCKFNVEHACRKAFAEAAEGFGRIVAQLESQDSHWKPAPDFSNITDWTWHGLAYADPSIQTAMGFVTASNAEQPLESVARDELNVSSTVCLLNNHFSEMAVVDLTTREFSELGVHVVKVVVPDAVPLEPDHRYPCWGSNRLFEAPQRMGYLRHRSTIATLNKDPHPFA